MPPDGGQQPEWARAAEELVRRVRNLVDDHGDAVERALTESLGSRDAARAELRKLDLLAQVLDLELWRRGDLKPSRKLVGYLASAALGALALVGVQTTNLVTADVYKAITGTQTQAETVAQQCDVEVDVDVFTLDQSRLDLTVGPSRVRESTEATGTPNDPTADVDPAVDAVFSAGGFSEPFYSGGEPSAPDEASSDDEPIDAAPYGRSTDPDRRNPRSFPPPSEGAGSIDGTLGDSP